LSTLSQKIHRPILDNEKIRFLTVSRLHSGKGLHLLLDVFSLIKAKYSNIDFELTIVGDGPLGDALADYAKSLDLLDRVNFSGVVANGSDLDFVYASHDVFIMPSLSETGPRVLIEAMSESNFCIASNVGYVNVLLGEGAGLMVKPGCIDALSKSILWVYDNKKKAQDMALKGFTESKKYSIESFFNQLLKA
jgi:glycosyltransferase involved in cell wall biosynthesis